MRRHLMAGLALALAGALAVGTAAAAPGDDAGAPTLAKPTTIAIAIGELTEADGEHATLDFRARTDGQQAGGALRFYSAEHGYYNGAVRTLTVENGTIRATGGGGLIQPDGSRIAVRYTATIPVDGKNLAVEVTGRNLRYTLAGQLDGLIKAGPPDAALPKLKPVKPT